MLLLAETDASAIIDAADDTTPDVLIIDSIQTVYHPDVQGAAGSVSQIRECAAALMRVAKTLNAAAFLVDM